VIAHSALDSWVRWNYSGEARLRSARAATEAWVEGLLNPHSQTSTRLYAAETFGYATCTARKNATAATPSPLFTSAERCAEFSVGELPIDEKASEDEWQRFLDGRLAQHGLKTLPRPGDSDPTSIRRRLVNSRCSATWAAIESRRDGRITMQTAPHSMNKGMTSYAVAPITTKTASAVNATLRRAPVRTARGFRPKPRAVQHRVLSRAPSLE